jgi:hypothetical protein
MVVRDGAQPPKHADEHLQDRDGVAEHRVRALQIAEEATSLFADRVDSHRV